MASGKRVPAGILAILLGGLGIHKFYLGKMVPGVIHIALLICAGLGWLLGIVEGVIYLTKSDDEFDKLYVNGDKNWL